MGMDIRTKTIDEPGLAWSIPADTRMGTVALTVADLDRQIRFYQEVVGLELHWREGCTAGMGGGGEDLLELSVLKGARRFRGRTGIYHFAILLPNRRELARAVGRLFELRYPNYPTDHIMTKTTYLDDPEGNTIEIYTESPEDGIMQVATGSFIARHADGTPSDGREALDVKDLFRNLSTEDRLDQPMPRETKIGHVHLYVADLEETMHFYHNVIGFDNMGIASSIRMGMVSAGGYHHHIGFNTWVGEGAPPPPPGALGLSYFTVVLPDQEAMEEVFQRINQAGIATEEMENGMLVRDSSKNGVLLTFRARL